MNSNQSFFRMIAVYVVSISTAMIVYRISRYLFGFGLGNLWMYFILAYLISLVLAFWGLTLKKSEKTQVWVKSGFLFAFAYFILDLASALLRILAGTQVNPAWAGMDEAMRTSLVTFSSVAGASLCFGANILLLVGLVFFGIATSRGKAFEKVLTLLILLYFVVLLTYTVSRFGRIDAVYQVIRHIYVFVPPVTHLLIGLWLWKGKEQ